MAGSRPNETSTVALASGRSTEPGAHAPARLVQPMETTRSTPGLSPPANFKMKAGATLSPAGAASAGAPSAGQAQDQPAPVRTQAACSATGVPALFQVRPAKRELARSCATKRSRNALAGAAAARQSAPTRALLLSIAAAHSSPASAASKAWVARYWLAELRCSNTRLRFTYTAASIMVKKSTRVMTSAATPRCLKGGAGRCRADMAAGGVIRRRRHRPPGRCAGARCS